jgi:hypothetical protein
MSERPTPETDAFIEASPETDLRLRMAVEEALMHLETNYDIDGATMAASDAAITLRAALKNYGSDPKEMSTTQMELSERPTPETDAFIEALNDDWDVEFAELTTHAKKLERERDEAREDAKRAIYDAAQETIKVSTVKSHWIEACRERDEARAENKRPIN